MKNKELINNIYNLLIKSELTVTTESSGKCNYFLNKYLLNSSVSHEFISEESKKIFQILINMGYLSEDSGNSEFRETHYVISQMWTIDRKTGLDNSIFAIKSLYGIFEGESFNNFFEINQVYRDKIINKIIT